MAKYLIILYLNTEYIIEDTINHGTQLYQFMEMVDQVFKSGVTKD